MPGSEETRNIVASYEIQHWIKFEGGATYINVTELNSFDATRNATTYEPAWLDKKVKPKYNLGRTDEFAFEVDMLAPGGAQQEFAKHEDDQNVKVEYVRTCAYDFERGQACAADALVAKHATATLNLNPMKQSDGNPARIDGTITVDSEYDKGTFSPSTATYTPADSDGGE